jgi:hypothetical protein
MWRLTSLLPIKQDNFLASWASSTVLNRNYSEKSFGSTSMFKNPNKIPKSLITHLQLWRKRRSKKWLKRNSSGITNWSKKWMMAKICLLKRMK